MTTQFLNFFQQVLHWNSEIWQDNEVIGKHRVTIPCKWSFEKRMKSVRFS